MRDVIQSIPYTPSREYDQAICLTYLIIRAGAKGRAKDSETATQRRDRKLLIKEKDLQRCESFLHA